MHPKIDIQQFSVNSLKILEKYRILLQKLVNNNNLLNNENIFDPHEMNKAIVEVLTSFYANPQKMLELQTKYLKSSIELINYGLKKIAGEDPKPLYQPINRDKRFYDESWSNNIYFDLIKQSYLMNANWLNNSLNEIKIDNKSKQRANFVINQILNALSPSNFIATNPTVMKETIATAGENLVKGLDNFITDIDKSKLVFDINRVDQDVFQLGKNIAATKGKVVYQNEMMQLIYYTPTRQENYSTPLLIIPPWINKYYILDLSEKNSLVKWLLEQGHSVFLISWVNPDANLANKSFSDYMHQGSIEAINFIKKITTAPQVNIMAYCLGGTLAAITQSYLTAKNENSIKSLSLLTTLLDFSQAGDILVFIDEKQLDKLDEQMNKDGYYSGDYMSSTFSLLRSNDMIWSFFINNYLLGKEPIPFDILFWNADSTRLPAKMHSYYLRNMYLRNNLAKGKLTIDNVKIDLSNISTPCYFLAAIDDHISPWEAVYQANHLIKSPLRFVLSGSGHVAGVVNPPAQQKYCYWTDGDTHDITNHKWLQNAKQHQGSWWEDWQKWIVKEAGALKKAIPQEAFAKHHIEDAPGSYVKKTDH